MMKVLRNTSAAPSSQPCGVAKRRVGCSTAALPPLQLNARRKWRFLLVGKKDLLLLQREGKGASGRWLLLQVLPLVGMPCAMPNFSYAPRLVPHNPLGCTAGKRLDGALLLPTD